MDEITCDAEPVQTSGYQELVGRPCQEPSRTEHQKAWARSRQSVVLLKMGKGFRYYFQHPWSRMIVAYLVIFFNFLIFAEDPVSHSQTEAKVTVVGNCFSFVTNKYPGAGWTFLKVLLWLFAVVVGLLAGKFIFHRQIFGRLLRLKMFRKDHGSWMTMFFSTILLLFIFSHIYNLCLVLVGTKSLLVEIKSIRMLYDGLADRLCSFSTMSPLAVSINECLINFNCTFFLLFDWSFVLFKERYCVRF
ncbi:transmembrane protein 117-like [Protopterus annectens]|uniref:transmembrane protein 117-like n=1 Tax=Protopterus annectens TaxID=7888 RepID=UPI001CFC120C|nr:transmembrane protein 117-like [Protopterus annectens]